VPAIISALSVLVTALNRKNLKMPRKRDRILGFFNRSRNASPAQVDQQASSSIVDSTSSTALAQSVPSIFHPQSSQASLPALVSPVLQVASSFILSRNPLTPPTESNIKEVTSVAWEGVKTALVLLKENSDWFPPLKSATGGLLAFIDATEVSKTISPFSSNHLT